MSSTFPTVPVKSNNSQPFSQMTELFGLLLLDTILPAEDMSRTVTAIITAGRNQIIDYNGSYAWDVVIKVFTYIL